MKKLFLPVILCLACTTAAAQEFAQGDRRIDLTIGVGVIGGDGNSVTTFDQHFGMEWGVGRIADQVTVGLGFSINNTYGSLGDAQLVGTYDYYYDDYVYSKGQTYYDRKHREGFGTADAKISREDINAQITVSFHYSPLPKLDIYTQFGVGAGVMNYVIGNLRNEDGFSEKTVDKTISSGTRYVYSYNDLDHVEWQSQKSKVVPAFSAFAGATYYFNDRWGVDAQVGLLSANIKDKDKGYPNSYGVFAVGVSYKF